MKTNKIKKNALILGLVLSQLNTSLIFATNIVDQEVVEEEFVSKLIYNDELIYSDKVFNLLSISEKLLYDYTKNGDISLLKKSIDAFCSTTTLLDLEYENELHLDKNFNTIFNEIRDEIYKISDIDIQSSLINYYGEKIFIGWRKNKNIAVFRDSFLNIGLFIFNEDKNAKSQPRLEYLRKLSIYFTTNPDLDSESDEIPDENNYPPKEDNDETLIPGDDIEDVVLPEIIPDKDDSIIEDNSNELAINSFFTEYIRVNNSCIQKVTFYNNGIPILIQEHNIPKSDYVKCGIYNYVHSNTLGSNIVVDNDYINTNQNEDSEYTIHFSINKSSKYPYYFNTGIRVNQSDLSASNNQLKDALYQLSIQSEGFSVTSNNKFLAIVEGKPIVLNKSKETYSKVEIETLLKSFSKSEFKILKPKDNTSGSLESYLSKEQVDTLLVDGNEIKLNNPFILIDHELYAPIEEIVSIIGAETDLQENRNLMINYGSTTIKLSVNSKTYQVNKNERTFTYSPIIHNSQIYSPIAEILSEFGYKLNWDSDLGELSLFKED